MEVTLLDDGLAMAQAPAAAELPRSWSPADLHSHLARDAMAPWVRAARHVVVTRAGEVVARCTAMLPRNATDGVGYLGFFDCVPDWDACRPALAAACDWLVSCRVSRILGPIDLSIWHRYRFQVSGHERPWFPGEPRNPPCYPAFWERFGFQPHRHWHTWDLDRAAMRALVAASAARGPIPPGHTAVPMQNEAFDHALARLHAIGSDAFRHNFGFAPVPLTFFRDRFAFLRDRLHPGLAFFVQDQTGRVVGFMLGFSAPASTPSGNAEQVVMYALGLTRAARGQGLVHGLMVPTFFQAALELQPHACISALHTQGPTFLDGVAAPTRRYHVFALAR